MYRPYTTREMYYAPILVHRPYQQPNIFPYDGGDNRLICFTVGGRLPFSSFATDQIPSLTVLSLDANQCLPRYRYTKSGERVDNITDWAVVQFVGHYVSKPLPFRGGA